MQSKVVMVGERSGFDDPRTWAFVSKAVHACHSTVSFSHCCHSHCCRTIFAPMSHRTAGIRTFDIRTLVSFALLTLSHCWHSHCWLRTGVVRAFVFRTLVVDYKRSFGSAMFDGACAHYVMVSTFQWKPFWLATQRDPRNDKLV